MTNTSATVLIASYRVTTLVTISLPLGSALYISIYLFWDINTIKRLLLSQLACSLTLAIPIRTQYPCNEDCTALTLFLLTYIIPDILIRLQGEEGWDLPTFTLRAAFLLTATLETFASKEQKK